MRALINVINFKHICSCLKCLDVISKHSAAMFKDNGWLHYFSFTLFTKYNGHLYCIIMKFYVNLNYNHYMV